MKGSKTVRFQRSRLLSGALVSALSLLGATVVPAAAQAAPRATLDIHHYQTNFAPGTTARLAFDTKNIGDAATSGPMALAVTLPPGVTGLSAPFHVGGGVAPDWSCPGVAGQSTIVCTTADSIGEGLYTGGPVIEVAVSGSASGDLVTTAILTGGGFADAPPAAGCAPAVAACATEVAHVSPTPAQFGIVPGTFVSDFYQADAITPKRPSGSHPDLASFAFDFNTVDRSSSRDPEHKLPTENIRDLRVDLPPGFLGNPSAVGECTPIQLIDDTCPLDSQVGIIDVDTQSLSGGDPYDTNSIQVYNMAHPLGVVNDLGFNYAGNAIHIRASLDPARNYAVTTNVDSINESLPVFGQKLTIWGVPGDSSHDAQRYGIGCASGCHPNLPRKAFLTAPFDCKATNQMTLSRYDSWENTGAFGPPVTYTLPGQTTECDKPRFEPDVSISPTGRQANTPTGIDVHIKVPQSENANAPATPPVKSTVVTFPQGMAVNPAFSDGLDGCTEAQIGISHAGVPDADPVACPDSSRIGKSNSPLHFSPSRSRARCIWQSRAPTPSAACSPSTSPSTTPNSAGSWSRFRAGSTSTRLPGRSSAPSTTFPSSPSKT